MSYLISHFCKVSSRSATSAYMTLQLPHALLSLCEPSLTPGATLLVGWRLTDPPSAAAAEGCTMTRIAAKLFNRCSAFIRVSTRDKCWNSVVLNSGCLAGKSFSVRAGYALPLYSALPAGLSLLAGSNQRDPLLRSRISLAVGRSLADGWSNANSSSLGPPSLTGILNLSHSARMVLP